MCDDEIHQGNTPALSRRAFAIAAAAAAAASPALAEDVVDERDVSVTTPDGQADAVLFQPKTGKAPAVLIWTDVLGLRPVFREMGRRVAAEGYVVLVPNPYYRARKAPVMDETFDYNKPDDRAKLFALAATLTPDVVERDAKAYLSFLDASSAVNTSARAGVHGYCMGGALSLRTAAALPGRIGALASFHGGGLVTAKPDSPHLLIPKLTAVSYLAVAANDDAREPTVKDVLKSSFSAANLSARVEVYDGASHGWCVPRSPVYNEPSAERAYGELKALYKKSLV
jgi:carboxymethylenebutenolidase